MFVFCKFVFQMCIVFCLRRWYSQDTQKKENDTDSLGENVVESTAAQPLYKAPVNFHDVDRGVLEDAEGGITRSEIAREPVTHFVLPAKGCFACIKIKN